MTEIPSYSGNEVNQVQRTDGDVHLTRLAGLDTLVSELFARGGAARFGFSIELFTKILAEVAAKYLQPEADAAAVRTLLSKIHVEELVLARACAAGNETAWDAFLQRYREPLYEAAISIADDYNLGHELADSLYADLWGVASSGTNSPLNSYMGYGSLVGWLRTILARSFIDRYRSQYRLVSLQEELDKGGQLAAPPVEPATAVDPRLEQATEEALQTLDAEERFILASFFIHQRTLAELSRVLRLHESSVSRRIHKITASVRKRIVRGMMRRGMSRRMAEEALQSDVRDLQVNIRGNLKESLQKASGQPSSQQGTQSAKGLG